MPQPSCMCTVLLKLAKVERLKIRKFLVHVLFILINSYYDTHFFSDLIKKNLNPETEPLWSKSVAFNSKTVADQWISKPGAWSRSGRIFLGSGDCFDALSHIVARVVNKIHIVDIACWLKLKYMCVKQSKFTPKKPQTQQIFKRGGARPVCRSLIRLCEIRNYFILFPIFYAWFMACEGYT